MTASNRPQPRRGNRVPVRTGAPPKVARGTASHQAKRPTRRLPRHAPVGVQLQRLNRPGQLARARRKRLYVRMGLTFFLFAMSVGGLSYVSHLDSLELRNISVSGTNMLSATAVRGVVDEQLSGRVSGIFSKRNVLLYPKSAIEAHLQEKFPALASAELESAGITSGDLLVSIQEREAFALWCAGMLESSCFAIDTTGFVFASAFQAQALDAGLLVFRGSLATTTDTIGAHVLPGEFQNVMSTIDALSRVVPGPASVHIENEKISLRYPSGLLVHFTTERSNNPEVLAANFRIALESEALSGVPHERIEYIDLRFENRLYYRLRGSSAQETDSAE